MRQECRQQHISKLCACSVHALYNFHEASGHHPLHINHHGEKSLQGVRKINSSAPHIVLIEPVYKLEAYGMSSSASHYGMARFA